MECITMKKRCNVFVRIMWSTENCVGHENQLIKNVIYHMLSSSTIQ